MGNFFNGYDAFDGDFVNAMGSIAQGNGNDGWLCGSSGIMDLNSITGGNNTSTDDACTWQIPSSINVPTSGSYYFGSSLLVTLFGGAWYIYGPSGNAAIHLDSAAGADGLELGNSYNYLNAPGGANAIYVGSTDAENYYLGGTHYFESRAGTRWVLINSNGVAPNTDNSFRPICDQDDAYPA